MAEITEEDLFAGIEIDEDTLFEGIEETVPEEERSAISRTLAPTQGEGIKIPDSPFLEAAAQTAITAVEIIDTPKRLLGALRGFSPTDPKSALLQPEAEKVEEFTKAVTEMPEEANQRLQELASKETLTQAESAELNSIIDDIKTASPGRALGFITAEVLREAPTLFLGSAAKGVKKIGESVFKGAGVGINRMAENITNLTEEAFSFLKTKGKEGVKQLEQAQGKFLEIGEELKKLVFDKSPTRFKENEIINKALVKMGDVPLDKTIKEIDKQIELLPLKSAQSNVKGTLEKIRKDIGEQTFTSGSEITTPGLQGVSPTTIKHEPTEILSKTSPATLFKRRERAMDDIINWSATGAKVTDRALKKIRKVMSNELIEVAKKTKNQEFILSTNSLSKKITALENLKFKTSTNEESFVQNLFGKGKGSTIKSLTEIEKIFGIKIKDRAKLAKLADEFEPRDFATNLQAPRRTGEGNIFTPAGLLGQAMGPATAVKVVQILEGLGKGAGGAADLAEAGITAAELGAITNFMKRLATPKE